MNGFGKGLSGILLIAILAVIVSNKSKTVSMMQNASTLFQKLIGVIVSPITIPANSPASGASSGTSSALSTGLDLSGISGLANNYASSLAASVIPSGL